MTYFLCLCYSSFSLFKLIHKVVDDEEAVYKVIILFVVYILWGWGLVHLVLVAGKKGT